MKIDRLLGITMYLLNRDIVSARTLAEKFEVSQRTIQRDIESLSLAGIPVTSLPGAYGGYEIMDSFKLNKQISNSEDYLFIITALKGLCSAYDNQKLDATIEKILLASNPNVSGKQKMFLDFKILREGKNTDDYIKLVDNSIDEEKAIVFDYTNADNKSTHRIVEPIALTYKWYSWYLLGYCTGRCDYRLFKLNRMDNLEKIEIPFTIKHESADFLLTEMEGKDTRQYCNIKLLGRKEVRKQILEYLNGKVIYEYDNGDFLLEMHVPDNERMWFSILLGFGDSVTVAEPEELRTRLREKAMEIINLYDK